MHCKNLFILGLWLIAIGCSREDRIESKETEQQQSTDYRAQQGRLRLKLKSQEEDGAELLLRTRATSGDMRITSMRRLFPEAGKFEERTRKEGLHLWYEIEFDEQIPVTRAISVLEDPSVEFVEPVYTIRNFGRGRARVDSIHHPVQSAADRPYDDPELGKQWHYSNDGHLPNSVAGADINLFRAWQKTQGSREVIVAVIDGGIDFGHEDLAGNVGNPAELFGVPGVDDDGNGYVDDIHGWNFILNNNRIEADDHGTHVGGTIGAENNNSVGVCGIAGGHGGHSGVWLLSCQLFGTVNGKEVSASFPEMIKYAADAGAVIAQNSWGYENLSYMPRADREAIDYFIKYAGVDENGEQSGPMKGGVVIFAAGNEDTDYNCYPAAYENVVSVSAYAPDYRKSWYSNFADWIDIAAPGGTYGYRGEYNGECAVYSTLPDNQYGYMQGTSMACPHVSGIAALVVSQMGGNGFTPEKLLAHLYRGTRDIYAYNTNYAGKLGVGAADAWLALSEDQGIAPDAVGEISCGNTSGVTEVSWKVSADEDDGIPFRYLVCWSETPLDDLNPEQLPAGIASLLVAVGRDKQVGDEIGCQLTDIRGEIRYYVAVVAIDPWGHYSQATTASFVSPYNEAPVIISENDADTVTLGYNQSGEAVCRISDPENQEFTYALEDAFAIAIVTQQNEQIRIKVWNYGFQSGRYPLLLKVTDSGGATSSKEIVFVLLPNEKPRLQSPFENIWFGSLREIRTVSLADHFSDEITGSLTYSFEFDPSALSITPEYGQFHVKPLKYGLSRIAVVATDDGGLSERTEFLVMTHDYQQEITLYPTPVRNDLNIRMGREVEGQLRVTLSRLNGQRIRQSTEAIAPFAPARIDLSDLSSGTYTITIEYQQEKWTKTILKE